MLFPEHTLNRSNVHCIRAISASFIKAKKALLVNRFIEVLFCVSQSLKMVAYES